MQEYIFLDSKETTEHLFLSWPFAKFVWAIVLFTYNIPPHTSFKNTFGNWLNRIDNITKARIWIGVSALYWSIWKCWNNIIFNNRESRILCKLSICDVGMPFGYLRISISGPAHYGGGQVQGLDKMTWRRRRKTLVRIRLGFL
jgi:hypothetical protein